MLTSACPGANCRAFALLPPLPLQIFLPVYDVAGAQEMSQVLWNAAPNEAQCSGFERVADAALAFAVLGEVDEKSERRCRAAMRMQSHAVERWCSLSVSDRGCLCCTASVWHHCTTLPRTAPSFCPTIALPLHTPPPQTSGWPLKSGASR